MQQPQAATTRKLEGVFARGYGVVPKAVMLLADLTPEAKALYAYYCVMSGNNGGFQPCAPEALILRTMGMSHARFLKHRKALVEQGLICFSQGRKSADNGKQLFETARYLIVKAPLAAPAPEMDPLPLQALAAVQEGVFAEGFGLVPRMVLLDHDLSVEAKAAYVFLCVYANASTRDARTATPSAALLTDRLMGRKRVQHAMAELESAGYIRRERLHTGVYGGLCYTLLFDRQEVNNDTTEKPLQEVKNKTAEKPLSPTLRPVQQLELSSQETLSHTPLQEGQNSTAESKPEQGRFETAKNETAQNEPAEIETPIINTASTNTSSSNRERELIQATHKTRHVSPTQSMARERDGGTGYWRDDAEFYQDNLEAAAAQIEANVLRQEYGDEIIDAIVHVMADAYCARGGTVNINGRAYPVPGVAKVYRALRAAHIEQVIETLREYGSNIANLQAYLTACLYNAPVTYGVRCYTGQ